MAQPLPLTNVAEATTAPAARANVIAFSRLGVSHEKRREPRYALAPEAAPTAVIAVAMHCAHMRPQYVNRLSVPFAALAVATFVQHVEVAVEVHVDLAAVAAGDLHLVVALLVLELGGAHPAAAGVV